MAWKKSSPALVAIFEAALPDDPRVERRQMFGYPAAFANGNLFTGLHQENLMVRLDDQGRAALQKKGGSPFEPMPGRSMREYVVVPANIVATPRSLKAWMRKSLQYAGSLPAKAKKPAGQLRRSGQ